MSAAAAAAQIAAVAAADTPIFCAKAEACIEATKGKKGASLAAAYQAQDAADAARRAAGAWPIVLCRRPQFLQQAEHGC